MASFRFCETYLLHIKLFVVNNSAISPFLGGLQDVFDFSALVAWTRHGFTSTRFWVKSFWCLKEAQCPSGIGCVGEVSLEYNVEFCTIFFNFVIIQMHICRILRSHVLQGGEDAKEALSWHVIFRKGAL